MPRMRIAEPAGSTVTFVDDGAGNIVPFGGGAAVGTINYTTGDVVFTSAISADTVSIRSSSQSQSS